MQQPQFELFQSTPWSVRWRVPDSLAVWWEKDWSKTAKAGNTKKCLKRISEFWALRFQDELRASDIASLREHLGALGLKANTINTHHTMVVRWINWLKECKQAGIAHDIDWRPIVVPATNIGSEVPKVNEYQFRRRVAWPKSYVLALIAASQRRQNQFMADLIDALYITRLRECDIWRITDKNVDFAHRVIVGIQHKSITRRMPSGLMYIIPITPRLENILRRRMEVTKSGDPLFRNLAYDIKTWATVVSIQFRIIRETAGLPMVQLRDLRPSGATLQMDSGADPLTVAEGLGHTTLRMLPVYARRTIMHQRQAQEKLEDDQSEIII